MRQGKLWLLLLMVGCIVNSGDVSRRKQPGAETLKLIKLVQKAIDDRGIRPEFESHFAYVARVLHEKNVGDPAPFPQTWSEQLVADPLFSLKIAEEFSRNLFSAASDPDGVAQIVRNGLEKIAGVTSSDPRLQSLGSRLLPLDFRLTTI